MGMVFVGIGRTRWREFCVFWKVLGYTASGRTVVPYEDDDERNDMSWLMEAARMWHFWHGRR